MPKTNVSSADALYHREARAVLEPSSRDNEKDPGVAIPIEFSSQGCTGGRHKSRAA